MTTEAFLEALTQGRLGERNGDYRKWRENHQELQKWQHRRREYETALKMVKGL
jgi:hypothetical protein